MGLPGIISSDLVSQHWADSLSLMRNWESCMRLIVDLWGGEDWECVCGLMMAVSEVCQGCPVMLIDTGLDMLILDELWEVVEEVDGVDGAFWWACTANGCHGSMDFEEKMVVMDQRALYTDSLLQNNKT